MLLAKQLACDPLPPLTALSEYNDAFFAGAEEIFSVRLRRRDVRALERLIPDPGDRAQIEALFDRTWTCSTVAWWRGVVDADAGGDAG